MKDKILITGGAGFIGSHLADRLLRAGHGVRLLDNLDPQVHPLGAPRYLPAEAELQVGSVLNPAAVAKALEGVGGVVHFAALVGVGQSLYQIARYNEVNLQGTAVLLEGILAARRRRGSAIGRLLVAGSMSMYGEGRYYCPACRAIETVGGRTADALRRHRWEQRCPRCAGVLEPRPTDEAKPPQLGSIYALSKYVQEEMCLLFGRTYGLPTVALRFFNAYGPRQALSNPYTGVAAVFASELLAGRRPQVFEDGRQLRSLVSVHDVTAACERALDSSRVEALGGGVFNIAGGEDITVAGLAQALARALGVDREAEITGRFRLGDARHCIADIGAARARMGYEPRVTIEAGMRELTDWLRGQKCAPGPSQRHATAELAAFGLTG